MLNANDRRFQVSVTRLLEECCDVWKCAQMLKDCGVVLCKGDQGHRFGRLVVLARSELSEVFGKVRSGLSIPTLCVEVT